MAEGLQHHEQFDDLKIALDRAECQAVLNALTKGDLITFELEEGNEIDLEIVALDLRDDVAWIGCKVAHEEE